MYFIGFEVGKVRKSYKYLHKSIF